MLTPFDEYMAKTYNNRLKRSDVIRDAAMSNADSVNPALAHQHVPIESNTRPIANDPTAMKALKRIEEIKAQIRELCNEQKILLNLINVK